jgi:FKBP-type peptidyl-prolyl cis-trans isomerase
MMTVSGRLLVFTLLLPLAACSSDTPAAPTITTSSAPYSQTDLVIGTGATAAATSTVTVSYSGWLYDTSKTDGKGTLFDTSTNSTFPLSGVIAGWRQGVPGMRVGGTRRLIVPPELAYGSAGSAPRIPPNATLIFDIGLLGVQ